jgi:hypothetical protein
MSDLIEHLQNAQEALAEAEVAALSATQRLATTPNEPDVLRNAATATRRVTELKADLRELEKALELAAAYRQSAECIAQKEHMKLMAESVNPLMAELVASAAAVDTALLHLREVFSEHRVARDACMKGAAEFHGCAVRILGLDQHFHESLMGNAHSLSQHFMQAVSSGLQHALVGVDAVSDHLVFSEWLTHANAPQLSCEKAVKKYRHHFEASSKLALKKVAQP